MLNPTQTANVIYNSYERVNHSFPPRATFNDNTDVRSFERRRKIYEFPKQLNTHRDAHFPKTIRIST